MILSMEDVIIIPSLLKSVVSNLVAMDNALNVNLDFSLTQEHANKLLLWDVYQKMDCNVLIVQMGIFWITVDVLKDSKDVTLTIQMGPVQLAPVVMLSHLDFVLLPQSLIAFKNKMEYVRNAKFHSPLRMDNAKLIIV